MKRKYGILMVSDTKNIGDDIQTYAASKFLPQIDYIIDRETIDQFMPHENEKIVAIMNGWYLHKKYNWPPSPFIDPLYIAVHFSKDTYGSAGIIFEHLEDYGVKYFADYKVGCRDQDTLKLLKDRGVNAYFSGCLTLTIDKLDNVPKGDYICLVDMNKKLSAKIVASTNSEIKHITHNIEADVKLSWDKRKKRVEEFLRLYQGAKLVITDRLHVALPCLALETPVLLVSYDHALDRTGTFLEHLYYVTEDDFLNDNYDYDINNPKENKKTYLMIREDLKRRCNDFIKLKEKEGLQKSVVSLETYKYALEKANYHKEVFIKVNSELNDMNEKLKLSKANVDELKREINKILNSKSWKVTKPMRIVTGMLSKKAIN